MKIKKLSIIALIALGLIGCTNEPTDKKTDTKENVAVEEKVENKKEDTSDINNDNKEETRDSHDDKKIDNLSTDKNQSQTINLGVLSGPTSAGAINMIDENKDGKGKFDIKESVEAAPDAVISQLVSGSLDMAIIPPNLAASVYNKTNGAIKALATNNLGVLYIVQNGGDEINSIEDLINSEETIYSPGKGSTPEIAIDEVISRFGYNRDNINIEFLPEATEVAQKLIAGEAKIALLPEPMVSNVLINAKDARVALDINKLYEEQMDNPLVSAVLVARNDYLDKINVENFLKLYKDSIDKANEDTDQTAKLLAKYEIMKEPVAKKALPNLALKYIDDDELKQILSEYLERLYNFNPKLIGGEMPKDDFYYKK